MDLALRRNRGDRDAPAAPKLEQPLVAEVAQRAQHRVAVDVEDRGQVSGRRQTVTGLGLAVGNRTANLGRHLLVEVGGRASIDVDVQDGASNNSFIW